MTLIGIDGPSWCEEREIRVTFPLLLIISDKKELPL